METKDYEHGTVPKSERKHWISIAAVWIAIGIDLSGAFLGVELAAGMDFWPAIGATLVGSVLLGLLAMACAYVGAATGLTTAMVSRAVFGKIGGAVLALAMSISLIGWFAVQAGFFGSNAQVAMLELTGIDWPVAVFTVLGGILMLLTALWGYRSISRLSTLAVPLLLILLIVGIVVAFATRGSEALTADTAAVYSFGGAVSLVMGIFVLGVVSAPDMARWAKTPKQAMAAGFFGFLFGNSIIIIVAVILSKLLNETELMTMFFVLGLGGFAVIVLILAQWTTNTTNAYSAAISFSSISKRFSRRTLTIIGGVIGIIVAVLGAADWFINFISAIGIVIAPFGGVYIANFFANRKHTRFEHHSDVPRITVLPVIAWLLGIATALMTTQTSDGLGFGLFSLTLIPALDGLLVAFVAALAFEVFVRRRAQRAVSIDGIEI
ncbi:cytosine permease [Agrococcus casei]|uniref:Cytosine/purine/uracil/thiamine/allantoin permease family protein n=1 Tax=Agrococcus casei LMG 22410 TaxID=1255656 RepID=A0A1R4GLN2_9MICO|nr:cytosine permease [Agrococcus casei]SJM69086.1 Cytosine/purine/uracil/thiamine/allantoin permease family protein [Agrococcus casei LMG 22410]